LKGINLKIFFNHGEEIAYHFDSLWSILEGPNLKIFFNHGEEIICLLGRFGAFCKYRISVFSSTMVKKSLII